MGGYVSFSGTTGKDQSINAASVPSDAGWALLKTIAVSLRRNCVEAQNQSTNLVQLVRDDGAGNEITSLFLAPAATSPGQGGGWVSQTFKGRLRLYGPSGSQVAAYED